MVSSQPPPNDHAEPLALARRLVQLAQGHPEVAERADRLLERAVAGRFHLAVVGDFKRGKSTLVNAIAGRELLPSGVVPLTAVVTEVHFGSARTEVVFLDGRRSDVTPSQIAQYVTERENPGNRKGVARVEVGTPHVLGPSGVVLVDTPGAGSGNEHNTQAAHAALAESDAAVLVLSADSPVSGSEQALMARLGQRGCRVFVVINKSDHMGEVELEEVEAFVTDRLAEHLDTWSGPYRTDARAALRAAQATLPASPPALASPRVPAGSADGFDALVASLSRFVSEDLSKARSAALTAELGRLSRQLEQALELEAAAGALDESTLQTQLQAFRRASDEGRRALADDRLVLEHDAAALVERAGERLAVRAASAAAACEAFLAPIATEVPLRGVGPALRDAIEGCVRSSFEPVRRQVDRELEAEWALVAGRFARSVQDRVSRLVGVAGRLFDVHLPVVPVPLVEAQAQHFAYQFLIVESPTAPLGRLVAAWLPPPRAARRRALRAARRRLSEEFDKHAGRARYDVARRVGSARDELVAAMQGEYEETQRTLARAAAGAGSLLQLSADGRAEHERRRADVQALVRAVGALGAPPRPTPP